jgi:Tfp pilus assembly protein PilF
MRVSELRSVSVTPILTLALCMHLTGCGGASASSSPIPVAVAPPEPMPSAGEVPAGGASLGVASGPSEEVTRGARAFELGNLSEAKAAFAAALAKNPKNAEALYYDGLVAEREGDKAHAEKSYLAALSQKPSLESAAVNLGALYIDIGRFDESVKVSQAAVRQTKDSAPLHSNLAVALASLGGREEESGKAFDAAARLAPKDAMVALTHGQWLGKWKQVEAARARLRTASELAGDDVGLLASAGFELKNVGAFADCIRTLDRAIAKKDAAELRTYRALCRLGEKDKPGALTDLSAAVAKEPNYPPAHFYLGGRLAEAGKRAEAAKAYETYLKLEPKGPLATAAAERVKILKKK